MQSIPALAGRRAVIIGPPGAGKSTLAERLSIAIGLPYLNLDSLAHQPYFKATPDKVFRDLVKDFVASNPSGWIIDGNYRNKVADITWDSASDIIWLDYPIYIVLWRLFFRTIARIRSGVKLWGMEGCVETWSNQFFSRDSMFLWTIWFYRFRRPQFHNDFFGKEKGRFQGTNIIRFQWPKQTEEWLNRMNPK